MQEYHPVQIFTDGASRGNPGPGGFGTIMIHTDTHEVYEYGGRKDPTTNNETELKAVHEALVVLRKKKIHSATIFTDSKYVYQGVTAWRFGWVKRDWKNKEGEPIKNLELWQEVHSLLSTTGFVDLQWIHVSGHMDIYGNERADAIATAYADEADIDLMSGKVSDDMWSQYLRVPTREEIEAIRERKRAHTSGEGCWYLSLIDGELQEHKTWAECKERVEGHSARYKKVCSEEEKEEALKSWRL